MLLGLPPPYNIAIGAGILSCSNATSRLAPLGLGMHTNRRAALATTMGMVTRVHNRSAHFRPATHPALPSGLADPDILVIEVANLADSCQTINKYLTHFTGWHTQSRVVAFLRHELRRSTSTAHHHATTAELKLDIV